MNLPNAITLSRLALAAVAFALLEAIPDPAAPAGALAWGAFAAFLVAAATDFLDGMLARRYGLVSAFGRVADPFCDKVLVCGALIYLLRFPVSAALLPAWVVVVVVARELLVTTLRAVVEGAGEPFPADRLGKWKMVAQVATAAALLTVVAGTDAFRTVAAVGVWVTAVLTVVSGAQYLWKARRHLDTRPERGRR